MEYIDSLGIDRLTIASTLMSITVALTAYTVGHWTIQALDALNAFVRFNKNK